MNTQYFQSDVGDSDHRWNMNAATVAPLKTSRQHANHRSTLNSEICEKFRTHPVSATDWHRMFGKPAMCNFDGFHDDLGDICNVFRLQIVAVCCKRSKAPRRTAQDGRSRRSVSAPLTNPERREDLILAVYTLDMNRAQRLVTSRRIHLIRPLAPLARLPSTTLFTLAYRNDS